MNSGHASHADSPGPGLASWYTPGRSDGFGDRLLMFDNTDAVSLELLRFRRELAVSLGFENALRNRVDQLADFRHPSFPLVRAVVHLDDHDLTLVSAHTPGQRLSELPTGKLRKGLHPAIVTWIVREVTPALAFLQSSGPGVAHGALSADRIVLGTDGRLWIIEPALGSAIRRLRLTSDVFWRQFGLLAPVDGRGLVRIDPRTDVMQLGTIALSLLIGRPVTLPDFAGRLPALLDEFSAVAAVNPSVFAAPLRAWLERALQLAPRSYRSAEDAQEALHELPVPPRPTASGHTALPLPDRHAASQDGRDDHRLETASVSRMEVVTPLREPVVRELPTEPAATPTTAPEAVVAMELPRTAADGRRWKRAHTVGLVATLVILALAEAAVITRLGTLPTIVSVAVPALPVPPQQPTHAIPVETAPVIPAVDPVTEPTPDPDAGAIALAAARQRAGGVRLSSPIELNVFEGDRVLGSTADGPIVATAGTHELELVNTALGYRTHQTVTIRAGVITPLTLTAPTGRININAQPWAQVLIDDSPIGDTPLANVSVPLGQHQITFRNPQMGERRETVTVRADTITRVTTSFER